MQKKKEDVKGCLSRNQLCLQIARKHHVSCDDVKRYLQWTLEAIQGNLEHKYATQLLRFGKFTLHKWPARRGHWPPNQKNAKKITVPARDVPVFKGSIKLKQHVRNAVKEGN